MRWIHTADWQLGMQAAGYGDAGDRIRAARLETVARILAVAEAQQVEAIVLAGDTFEHNAVDPALVQAVADRLRQAPCPVYVLPGNHDPWGPGSVWQRSVWERVPTVTIWHDRTPVPFGPHVVFPCPVRVGDPADADPLAWIPPRAPGDTRRRIAVAHGVVRAPGIEDRSAPPIPLDAPARYDLDYVALGHWHSQSRWADGRMAYAGTPEPTRFGEPDSGKVWLVTDPDTAGLPRLEPIAVQTLHWHQETVLLTPETVAAWIARLDAVPPEEAARTLWAVRWEGTVSPALWQQVEHDLWPLWQRRSLWATDDRRGLYLAPTEADWAGAAGAGLVRAAVDRLLAEARGATPEAADRARGALEVLWRWVQEEATRA